MLEPSSHLEADQYIITKDTPLASSFLLEQKHSSDLDSSCHGDNGFLSPPTSNNFSSQITLDFGSPSRELPCTEDFSSGWESPPGNMVPSCCPSVGWDSLSQGTGINGIEIVDFTHDFASIECGSDSFLFAEESSILGSPDDYRGMAPYLCDAEGTNLHIPSTSRLGSTISTAVQNTVGDKIRSGRQKSRKRWSETWKHSAIDLSYNTPSLAVTCDKTCCPEQIISTATPGTLTEVDSHSVFILQSASPGQGKPDQLLTNLSSTDMLLDTDGDSSFLNGTLASETGKPSEASRGLDIPALWDGFENYDSQCDFEQTSSLNAPALFDHSGDLESFHDALAESSRYLETQSFGKQCVSNLEGAKENMGIKPHQNNTVPNRRPALITTNLRLDVQHASVSEQSHINHETMQGGVFMENQLIRTDALEYLLLSTKQTGLTNDTSYLYSTSSGGAEHTTCVDSTELPEELDADSSNGCSTNGILFSYGGFSQVCKGFNHTVPLGSSIDTFTTTYETSNDQFLQGTKPSYMISCDTEVGKGMPQVTDVNTTQTSTTTIVASENMSGNDKVGLPQVFSSGLDTVPAPFHDTFLIQTEDGLVSPSNTDVNLVCFENDMYVLPNSHSWTLSNNLHFSAGGAVSSDELQKTKGQSQSSLGTPGYNGAAAVQQIKPRSEDEGTEGTDQTLDLLPSVVTGPKRGHGIEDQLKNKRRKFQTQSLKHFPPRMCNKDKSVGVESNQSSSKEDQLDAVSPPPPEPVSLRTSLPIQQYHEKIYIFPFDLHKHGQKGETADELLPPEISDEVLNRISASLALHEACTAKSREAHKKLKAMESTDCIGRVHTEQGDFYCHGQYLHRKTVKQMLKEAGFQQKDNETEIFPPVRKRSRKNRLRKKTSLSFDVKSRQEHLSGKKRKAEEQQLLGNQEHKKCCADSNQKVLCYNVDSLRLCEQKCARGVPTKPGKGAGVQLPVISQHGDVVESQQSVAVTSRDGKEPGSQLQVISQVEAGNQRSVTRRIKEEIEEQFPLAWQGMDQTENQHPIACNTVDETEEQHTVTCQLVGEVGSPITRKVRETLLPFTSQTRDETREEPVTCQLTEKAVSKIGIDVGNHLPVTCWEPKDTGSQQSVTFQMRKKSRQQHLVTNQMRVGEEQYPVNIQFGEETKNLQSVSNQEAENQQQVNDQQRKESGSQQYVTESQQSVTTQCKEGGGSQQLCIHHCAGEAETQQLVTCQSREQPREQLYASRNSSQEEVSCQEEVQNEQFVESHEPLINDLAQKVEIQYQVIHDNSVFLQEEGLQHPETEQHPVISQCKVNAKYQQQLVTGNHSLHPEDTGIQQPITCQYQEESESQLSVAEQQAIVNQHTEAGRQPVISHIVEQTVEEQEPVVSQHWEKTGNQDLNFSHNNVHKEEAEIHQSRITAEQQPSDSQHLVQADTEQLVNSHDEEEACLQLNVSLYVEEAQSQQPGNSQYEEEAVSQQSTAASSYHCEKGQLEATTHHQEMGILQVKKLDAEELTSHKVISSQHTVETGSLPVTAECREETGTKQTVAEKEQAATCQDRLETSSKDPVTSLCREEAGDSAPTRGKKCQAFNKVNLDDSSSVSESFDCKTNNIILYPSDSPLSSQDIDEDANIVCCSPERDTFEMTKESEWVETERKPVPSSFVVRSDLDLNTLPVVRKMGKVIDSETIYNGEIESLYRAPFLLVVHQAAESSSISSVLNSDVMVVEARVEQAGNMRETVAVTEGTCFSLDDLERSQSVLNSADTVLPVVHCQNQVSSVVNNAHQAKNTVNPCDAVIMVNSVSQHVRELAMENTVCTGDAVIAPVPTCTTDFADLTDLLQSNNQVVQPYNCKHENDLVWEASEKTSHFGNQLQNCSFMSAAGVHPADPVSVFGDGLALSGLPLSEKNLLDRAQSASSCQSHFSVDSICAAPSTGSFLSDYYVTRGDTTPAKPLGFSFHDVSVDQFHKSTPSFPVLSVTDGSFGVPSSENSQQNSFHALSLGTMVDFEDCVSMTGLEDFIGDCLLGASDDFVEDFILKDAEDKQGNGTSLSAVTTDHNSGDVKSIATQNLTTEKQVSAGFLPFLGRSTKETFHDIIALGTSSRSAFRKDVHVVRDIEDQNKDRETEANINKTCQTYCKDMPGPVSCQISESKSKDSVVFESREDGNSRVPAVPADGSSQLEFSMHPDVKPVGLRFTVQGGFETSSVHNGLSSDILKTDVIHQMETVSCGVAENDVKSGLCVDSVGINCTTTQTCHGRTISSACEADPLEVWMETMHSCGDSTFDQNVEENVKKETVTDTFLMNGGSLKWNPSAGLGALPQVKCRENDLLYPPECLIQLNNSMPSAQGSTSVFSANTTSKNNCENYTKLIETSDSVHENNSLSADSSFEFLLEAFSQCSASASDSQSMLCGPSEEWANEKMPMENLFPRNHVYPTILGTEQTCSASNIVHTAGCAAPDTHSSSQMTGNLQASVGHFVENNNIKDMETKGVQVPCHTSAIYVGVPELQSCLASIHCGELSLVSSTKAQDVQYETSFSQSQMPLSVDPLGVSHGSVTLEPEETSPTNASSVSSASHIDFHGGKMFADTFTFSTDNQLQNSNSLLIKDSLADKSVSCISMRCCPTLSCTTSSELQVASRTPALANNYWSLNSPALHSVKSSSELSRPMTSSSVASSSTDSSSLALSPLFSALDDHLSDATCHPKVSCSSESSPFGGQSMECVLPPTVFSSVENISSASALHMSSNLNDSSSALNVFLGLPPLVSSSSYVSPVDASVFPILSALHSSDYNASPAAMPLLPTSASSVFSRSSDSCTQVPHSTSFGPPNSEDLLAITNVLPELLSSDSSTSLTSSDSLAHMPVLTDLSPPVPNPIFLPVPSLAALSKPSNSSEPTDVSSRTAEERFSKITPLAVNVSDNVDNTYLSRLVNVFSSSCPAEKTSTAQPLHAPCQSDAFSSLSNVLPVGSKSCSSDTSLFQSVQSLLSELESSGSFMTSPATTSIESSFQSQIHRPLSLEVLPLSVSSQLVSSPVICSHSQSAQPSVPFSFSGRQSVPASLAVSSSGLSVSRGQTVPSPGTSSLFALPQSSAAGNSDAQKHCTSLTLSSRPASALGTSTMKFVVTPVPPNRFQPPCPCHPLVLDDGGESPGLRCIPFSPAILNCPTMVATPCVAARPQDLPQNPCCISKDIYEYSPSANDIHMAQMMYKKAIERNAKAPARHCMTYRIDTICIGDFTFTVNTEKHSKDSNVWISYLKKKLCYNMVFTQPVEDANCLGHCHVIRTEILFSSIIGLWGCGNKLLLELSSAPAMFQAGSWRQSKQGKLIDITGGQMEKLPYHFLTFIQPVADIVKRNLCEDPNFCRLLIRPVTVDLNKTYRSFELIEKDSSENFCMCKGTCQHMKCYCFRLRRQCSGSCLCKNCHNQFNQLHRLRFPLNEVHADPCLMDMLSQVKNVSKFLETPVRLECCGTQTTFLYCTPGRQQCHKCSAYLQLSWCLSKVFIENSKPPHNHCKQCKRCVKVFKRHCEACRRCTKHDSKGSCLACVHKHRKKSPKLLVNIASSARDVSKSS